MNKEFTPIISFGKTKLDNKGRMALVGIRSIEEGDTVVIEATPHKEYMEIYPYETYLKKQEKYHNFHEKDEVHNKIAITSRVDKQRRIIINADFLESLNIDKNIVLIGKYDHILVYDASAYEEMLNNSNANIRTTHRKFKRSTARIRIRKTY